MSDSITLFRQFWPMETIELQDFNEQLPDKIPVTVIMEKAPSSHAWADYSYKAVGVIATQNHQAQDVKLIHQENAVEQYLVSGLNIQLYVDECESYYHNLMSPKPGCFVVADENDDVDEMPLPFLVSLSFDEVHAYHEGGQQVYAVQIPASLYQWTEAYVLTHYVATKKIKRKLNNWKQSAAQANAVIETKL